MDRPGQNGHIPGAGTRPGSPGQSFPGLFQVVSKVTMHSDSATQRLFRVPPMFQPTITGLKLTFMIYSLLLVLTG
jgi:hypothetical protein